jgi:hypothetical protein
MSRPESPLSIHERTAYHEAGHAVVALLQDNPIRERGISVHASESGTSFDARDRLAGESHFRGRVYPGYLALLKETAERLKRPDMWETAGVQAAAADIRECLAGPIAEAIATGVRLSGIITGFGDQRTLLPSWQINGDTARVRVILHELAAASGPTFDQRSFQLKCQNETAKMLRRPTSWRAVTWIAEALLIRGHLEAEEAEGIVSKAGVRLP